MCASKRPDGSAQDSVVSYEVHAHTVTAGAHLSDVRVQCMQAVLPYTTGYIWQDGVFSLQSSTDADPPWIQTAGVRKANTSVSAASDHHVLWGTTSFGDNVEDEWFIVWLLLHLTRQFSNLSARVWDNDGDFLLIEAAFSLPKWLKPEVSTNRVWLHDGQLHIVPLPSKRHPTLPPSPTPRDALQIIRSEAITTQANTGMQNAISSRIKGYPQKALSEMHRARCRVPAKVAAVLKQQPQLVSPAVQAFYYRDVQDMKAAARLRHLPFEDLTTELVTFNRALYAQLSQQQFQAPKGYAMPAANSPAFKHAELGMKLTCGFEMLLARHKPGTSDRSDAATPQQAACQDCTDSPQWAAYKASLDRNGYFQGNIPGSTQHKQLLAQAMQSFAQVEAYKQAAADAAAPAETIIAILQQPIDVQAIQSEICGPEDDDSWMTGGAADLEAELAQRQKELEADMAKRAKRTAQGLSGSDPAEPEFDPTEVVSRMKAFVDQVSSHEGAEVPDEVKGVSLNDSAFWRELSSALGVANDQRTGLEEASDASSDFSDPFDESEHSSASSSSQSAESPKHTTQGFSHTRGDNQAIGDTVQCSNMDSYSQHAQHDDAASRQLSPSLDPPSNGARIDGIANSSKHSCIDDLGADTATDSDDADYDSDSFTQAYDQTLEQQLAGSRVGNLLQPGLATSGSGKSSDVGQAAASTSQANASAEKQQEELKPVDLDTNLVQNLLQSYAAQEGLAGPAGNLAGLLGLQLPRNAQ